jgi:hypothetical protein
MPVVIEFVPGSTSSTFYGKDVMDGWPALLCGKVLSDLETHHAEQLDGYWCKWHGRVVTRQDQSHAFNYTVVKAVFDSILPAEYTTEIVELNRFGDKRLAVHGGIGRRLVIDSVVDADSYAVGHFFVSFERVENEAEAGIEDMRQKASYVGGSLHPVESPQPLPRKARALAPREREIDRVEGRSAKVRQRNREILGSR